MLLRYLRSLTGFERDARLFLVITVLSASAVSLWWIDFNLYLRSLGIADATVGLVATAGSAAALVMAIPAGMMSDRLGRRLVMVGGGVLMTAAFAGLLLTSAIPVLFLASACFAAGSSALNVVALPFLAEHSRPEQRSELFAVQFAISNGTNVVAALLGGAIAQVVAQSAGFDPQSPQAYRILIALMAVLGVAGVLMLARLRDDRPGRADRAVEDRGADVTGRADLNADRGLADRADASRAGRLDRAVDKLARAGQSTVRAVGTGGPGRTAPPAAGVGFRALLTGRGIANRADFARLLLPGFLISLGAGQVIPFLNLFVERKFGLQLASINALFALTSLGTLVATLIQPALARRFGKIGSVVLVQGTSIPFIVVLGFSPVFWTVAVAMAVRNSLMNAGNPIFNAFAMERVRPEERAIFAAASGLLWSLGWVIAGPWYSLLQATLGFDAGYTVNFITIVLLYTVGTTLYWVWFGRGERRARQALAADAEARAAASEG